VNHEEYKLARVGLARGRAVELKVERAGQSRVVRITPWDRSDGIPFEHLGLKVKTVEKRYGSYIQITEVQPDGPAARLGLKPDDAIDAVRPLSGSRTRPLRVPTREHFANLISEMGPGTKLELDVYRDVNHSGGFEDGELHRGTLTLR